MQIFKRRKIWNEWCELYTEERAALWLEDITCKGRAVLTVYSKRGRCFRFSDHVLHHACIGALIRRGHLANNQGMVLQDFESAGRTDTQNREMKDGVEKRRGFHGTLMHQEGLCALPALRQVRIIFSPADSGNRVSLNNAVELHALVCQHHHAAGPLLEGRALWSAAQQTQPSLSI